MTCCAPPIPAEITQGLDFQAQLSFADFPATVWDLHFYARGPSSITLAATDVGQGFLLEADAAATGAWTPGAYWWTLRATQGQRVAEVAKGNLTILPDLASVTTPYDGRSPNEIALEALDAVIGKRATLDQQRYKINERELWRMSIADLMKLRAYYATQVRRERARLRGCSTFGRPVVVRFNSQ